MNFPPVSIAIATLNSARLLPQCLESIMAQNYPRDKMEVLIIDGGSQDKTVEIAKAFSVNRIIPNPLKTAEAAYAISIREAKNKIIAHIDSDNVLPSKDWLCRMVEPFEDEEIVTSEPLYYSYRANDNLLTRYFALIGMSDPLCRYLGNYDRFCSLTGKWIEVPAKIEETNKYFKIELKGPDLPTMGANGFLFRTEDMAKCYPTKDYWFDNDSIYALVKCGRNKFAKVKVGMVHIFAGNFRTFAKKQRRRIKDYLFYEGTNLREFPLKGNNVKIAKFVLSTFLISPLLLDVLRGLRRTRDKALLLHVPACWITLFVYGVGFLENKLKRELASRENW